MIHQGLLTSGIKIGTALHNDSVPYLANHIIIIISWSLSWLTVTIRNQGQKILT